MSKTARVLIVVALIVCAGLFFKLKSSSTAPPSVAKEVLFAASFPDAQNRQQNLAQWRGKVLVINFWASWCPPCREEMPALNNVYTRYVANGVVFVGISAEDVDKLQQFTKEMKIAYPLLAGDFDAMSLAQSLGNDKSILPYTVIVDKNGKIAKVWYGTIDISELETQLKTLI